jgi:hypothetical protein
MAERRKEYIERCMKVDLRVPKKNRGRQDERCDRTFSIQGAKHTNITNGTRFPHGIHGTSSSAFYLKYTNQDEEMLYSLPF